MLFSFDTVMPLSAVVTAKQGESTCGRWRVGTLIELPLCRHAEGSCKMNAARIAVKELRMKSRQNHEL
ncbi:MAG: hypothetical protein ACI4NW_13070 [Stenotrophomonas sp.]